MSKREVPVYRVSYQFGDHWTAYVTRTRNPVRITEILRERYGYAWKDILVELRPGKGIKMPMPKGPQTPKVTTGG